MSFRKRPVIDRKHRPRWQDELRTQQLTVAGFAIAIAVAIGIFAAVAWSSFYNGNLRQVALVHGEPVDRAELTKREDLIAAQLSATYLELSSQLVGGPRDQIINQQLQQLQQALNSVGEIASDSIVTGLVLDSRAEGYGLSVSDEEVDAAVAERRTLPERIQLALILVEPELDEGVDAGAEPTEQDWAEAKAEIDEVKAQLDGGAEFAELATEHTDGVNAEGGGMLGWITANDTAYGDYFEAAGDAEPDAILGPTRNDEGWYLLHVVDRQAEQQDERLADFLAAAGISDEDYRALVRQDLLQAEFREYFTDEIIGRYAPQRHVAQILIQADEDSAAPAPSIQVRHLLVQPDPELDDQAEATDEQWAGALQEAEELREAALEDDADWYVLAEDSDDAGSRTRGGSLGWYDPSTLDTQFVPEFAEAVADLEVGEVSEPVRSEFGYHVIQVTDRRVSATELAARLSANLQEDPDAFEETARDYSEDPVTAREGGDLGWVIPYELDEERQEAVFALTEPGQVTEPLVTDAGIYIFKLIESSPSRWVPPADREQVAGSGFSRWLTELEDQAGVWIDPQLAPATTTDGTVPIPQ